MITPVALKKILSLHDPYQTLLPGLDTPLNAKEVAAYVLDEIKADPEGIAQLIPSTRLEHLQKIAHHVWQRSHDPIKVNIGYPERGDHPDAIISPEDFHRLAACMHRADTWVMVDATGSPKALKALLDIDVQAMEQNTFSWVLSETTLHHTWSDPEFVYRQILSNSAVFALASRDVWTEKFLHQVMEGFEAPRLLGSIDQNDKSFFEEEKFIKVVAQYPVQFKSVWSRHYEKFYSEDEEFYDEGEKKNPFKDSPQAQALKQRLFELVFSNPNVAAGLVQQNICLYEHLSDGVKADPVVVQHMHDYHKKEPFIGIPFHEWVSKNYFDDLNNTVYFFNNLYHKQHVVLSCDIFESWVNDREHCAQVLRGLKTRSLHGNSNETRDVYGHVAPDLRNDKDFHVDILKSNPALYGLLSKEMRSDPDIIKAAFTVLPVEPGLYAHIPADAYASVSDPGIILGILKEDVCLLEKKKWPGAWSFNKQYFLDMGDAITHFSWTPKIMGYKEVMTDKAFLVELIARTPDIYGYFPKHVRDDPKLVTTYLTHTTPKGMNDLLSVPANLWLDKNFCLDVFEHHKTAVSFFPSEFFNHKDFVLSFFKKLEGMNEHPLKPIIEALPKPMIAFLGVMDVKKDHHDFFKRYFLKLSLDDSMGQKDDEAHTALKKPKI